MNQKKAALLIIGDELLVGRVRDENLSFLSYELSKLGIKVTQARFISDNKQEIIKNIQELYPSVDYLLLTGGIGPTHDDVTTEAVSEAFNLKYELHSQAYQILEDYYKSANKPFLEGSKKMAYLPANAELLYNKLTYAPGFKINKLFVFPGVPFITKQIFIDNKHLFESGLPICSKSLIVDIPESKLALELRNFQNLYHNLSIGSYPKLNDNGSWITELVVTSNNLELLDKCFKDLINLINTLKG